MKHRGSVTHTSTRVSKLLPLHCRRFPAWLSPPSFLLLNIPFSLYNPSLFAVVLPQFSSLVFHLFTLLQPPSFTTIPPLPLRPLTRLLSTPFSVPPPKRAGTPKEINRPSVNVTPSPGGGVGVGVEREKREDELPLRDATTRSAILRWGVVMEENSAMMLGRGADRSGD